MDLSFAELSAVIAANPSDDLARNRLDNIRAEKTTDPSGNP
jgi:hypothetical protein